MTKITSLTSLTSPQYDDLLPVVDVHDQSMASSGTTKKATLASLAGVSSYNVKTYGAKGDGKTITDAAITTGTTALTSSSAGFTTSDVGKILWVAGAGTTPAPVAPLLFSTTVGGTVAAGTYQVKVTFVNANGETVASSSASITTTGSTSTIHIESPAPAQSVTGWYAYVTQAGGSTYTRQQSPGSPTTIGAPFVLTAAPSSGGANPPGSNTATGSTLSTTISAYVSATQVTLAATATATTSGATATYGTDDTTAITSAITAASNAGSGTVLFSEGNFITTGVTLSTSHVNIRGRGSGTNIIPTPGSTALTITNSDFNADMEFSDMLFSVSSSSLGIQVNGAGNSNFSDLWFTGPNAAGGVSINGDDPTEQNWNNCTFYNLGGTAFGYTRTNTVVNGGIYMTAVRCASPPSGGAHGFSYTSTASSATEVDIWMFQCVADAYYNDAVWLCNVTGVKCFNPWFANRSGATSGSVPLHITGGTNFLFVGGYMFQALTGASAFVVLQDNDADSAAYSGGLWLDGGSGGGYTFGLTNGFGARVGEVFWSATHLADAPWVMVPGNAYAPRTPFVVLTQGTNGSAQSMGIDDANNIGSQVWIRNNAGTLQFRNTAFSSTIASLDQSGNTSITGNLDVATAGSGLKVAEGTNAKQGTAVLVAGSKVVSNTSVTANSRIFLTSNADGGTPGWLRVSARTAGTSFTITSSSGTDTSTVAYQIFEPG